MKIEIPKSKKLIAAADSILGYTPNTIMYLMSISAAIFFFYSLAADGHEGEKEKKQVIEWLLKFWVLELVISTVRNFYNTSMDIYQSSYQKKTAEKNYQKEILTDTTTYDLMAHIIDIEKMLMDELEKKEKLDVEKLKIDVKERRTKFIEANQTTLKKFSGKTQLDLEKPDFKNILKNILLDKEWRLSKPEEKKLLTALVAYCDIKGTQAKAIGVTGSLFQFFRPYFSATGGVYALLMIGIISLAFGVRSQFSLLARDRNDEMRKSALSSMGESTLLAATTYYVLKFSSYNDPFFPAFLMWYASLSLGSVGIAVVEKSLFGLIKMALIKMSAQTSESEKQPLFTAHSIDSLKHVNRYSTWKKATTTESDPVNYKQDEVSEINCGV